jgi:hypothetical protein
MKNACNKREGRRDRHSQAASLSNNGNGATNVLRIMRNFNPPAVNSNAKDGGACELQLYRHLISPI